MCEQKLLPVYLFTYFAQYMEVACWHTGGGQSMARKPIIEQVKMLCVSNKEEITKIDFSIINFLKMIITCTIFAAFIWKWAAASASFCFCSSEK